MAQPIGLAPVGSLLLHIPFLAFGSLQLIIREPHTSTRDDASSSVFYITVNRDILVRSAGFRVVIGRYLGWADASHMRNAEQEQGDMTILAPETQL